MAQPEMASDRCKTKHAGEGVEWFSFYGVLFRQSYCIGEVVVKFLILTSMIVAWIAVIIFLRKFPYSARKTSTRRSVMTIRVLNEP